MAVLTEDTSPECFGAWKGMEGPRREAPVLGNHLLGSVQPLVLALPLGLGLRRGVGARKVRHAAVGVAIRLPIGLPIGGGLKGRPPKGSLVDLVAPALRVDEALHLLSLQSLGNPNLDNGIDHRAWPVRLLASAHARKTLSLNRGSPGQLVFSYPLTMVNSPWGVLSATSCGSRSAHHHRGHSLAFALFPSSDVRKAATLPGVHFAM